MKRSIVVFAGAVFFLFAALVGAYAVEISADMVTKEGKITRNGKIYIKDTKARIEKGSSPIYAIIRGDKKVFWQINGAEKTYLQVALTPDMRPATEEKLFGETSRKLVGPETVNGYAAKKYEVTVKAKNKTETVTQWFSSEYNFPVKIVTAKWTVEYKNIKKGGVADTVFELPAGAVIDATEVPDVLH